MATAFGALACLQGLGSRVVTLGALWSGRTGRLCTRPNRAAAHPSTDTHTGRHEKTGQKAPESHQEASESGRCGVGWGCSIGASRGAAARRKRNASPIVRSWSRNPKFDTRLPVSKAGGRSLAKGKASALSSLWLLPYRHLLERGCLARWGTAVPEAVHQGLAPCGRGSCPRSAALALGGTCWGSEYILTRVRL